jgi:hypothetical protein
MFANDFITERLTRKNFKFKFAKRILIFSECLKPNQNRHDEQNYKIIKS